MKKVILCVLLIAVLVPLAFVIYSMWWIEHTQELFAPAEGYCYHTAKLLQGWCAGADTCCASCLRDLMHYTKRIESSDIEEDLEWLTPPENIRHLGYLVANGLKLPDDRAIPILVCKTPLASVRTEEGEPPGKNHLAGFANVGLQKSLSLWTSRCILTLKV